jgi:hypothetical protein
MGAETDSHGGKQEYGSVGRNPHIVDGFEVLAGFEQSTQRVSGEHQRQRAGQNEEAGLRLIQQRQRNFEKAMNGKRCQDCCEQRAQQSKKGLRPERSPDQAG